MGLEQVVRANFLNLNTVTFNLQTIVNFSSITSVNQYHRSSFHKRGETLLWTVCGISSAVYLKYRNGNDKSRSISIEFLRKQISALNIVDTYMQRLGWYAD